VSLSRPLKQIRTAFRHPILVLSSIFLVFAIVCALAAPYVAPFDPNLQALENRLAPPLMPRNGVSFLGADPLGRDILSRVIFGSRVSLAVAASAVLLAGTIGVVLGLIAGLTDGPFGAAIMRVADIQFSVPTLVLALALVAVVGPGLLNIIVVLGVSGWVPYARVMRAQVLVIKKQEYVEAARALGASDLRVARRHVLPNAVGVVAVIAAVQMAHMMISEASLSFLGLGVPPGTATWGAMIADGRNYLYTAWWVSTFPGLTIVLVVVALNVVGDWLSDIANPALRDW